MVDTKMSEISDFSLSPSRPAILTPKEGDWGDQGEKYTEQLFRVVIPAANL